MIVLVYWYAELCNSFFRLITNFRQNGKHSSIYNNLARCHSFNRLSGFQDVVKNLEIVFY